MKKEKITVRFIDRNFQNFREYVLRGYNLDKLLRKGSKRGWQLIGIERQKGG